MVGSIASLREAVAGEMVDAPEALVSYARDASHVRGTALAVVRPADPSDLARLVGWARQHRTPLVARGGGTSLDGESVPFGAVVVDLAPWNRIREVDLTDRLATVEPGVVNFELHRTLRSHGLFFPPNPGSWTSSTLGGNVATNAAGPRAFKYGAVRRWVLGAEVVLGTGELLTVGGRSRKRSVGPDLLGFFVGSEGTLGFFTQLTLALASAPARRTGVIVPLPSRRPVGSLVREILRAPRERLSAVEYLDVACAGSLADEAGSRFPADRALLLLELESEDAAEEERELTRLLDGLRRAGIEEDPNVVGDADALWTLRGQSGTALDRRLGERIREDVAVPLSALDALFTLVEGIADRHGVSVPIFGHVGDGNLHPNFVIDPSSPAADAIRSELLAGVLRLRGTISGEHGVGSVKSGYLTNEVGPVGIRLLRSVKQACDPDGILNPGKLLPSESGGPD
jgi:FAD/FMN-containing dehydrogenase